MYKIITVFLVTILFCFVCRDAQANIVFPAIAHQFMVSMVVPGYYSIVLAILVLLIEAFLIKKFLSKSWIYSFGLSFLINLISSILGAFFVSFRPDLFKGIFAYENMRLGTYLGMVPGYGLTVFVELVLLMSWAMIFSRNKFEPKNLIKVSLIMNFWSYLILLSGIYIVDVITHGQNFKTY